MSLNTVTPISLEPEFENLELFKYSPSSLVNATLNRLKRLTDGEIDIIEPNNPFLYLVETNCLNTSFAIQEYALLTRKLYPRLANNENDLYHHMSDFDYLGRFSEPSFANVHFNILYADFLRNSHFNPILKEHVFMLPRNLRVNIDNMIFTLPQPIVIKKTENNVIDVRYDHTLQNDLFPLETNFINFDIYSINQNEKYISFSVRMPEIDIEMLELPIEKSKLFKNTINFNSDRNFYFFQAFYEENGTWKSMIVTHSDEVYDINTPTVCIKVFQETNSLEYYVPSVYINTNRVLNKVKFLIYTTKGFINVNFNDYKISNFTVNYNRVFPELELNELTAPLQVISKVVYIRDKVIGGKNRLSFDELKKNVINNSIGDRKLPITMNQVEFLVRQNNFRLIKDVDVITNRIFGLEVEVPNSTTSLPISKINFDQIEYQVSIRDLQQLNVTTSVGEFIHIIPENTLFKIDNNKLRMLNSIEKEVITSLSDMSLVDEINSNTYLSTYFHYVLDLTNVEPDFRTYELNQASVLRINFKNYNNTSRIGINTISSEILKRDFGYQLSLRCNYKKYIEGVTYNDITPYLVYETLGSRFFLKGNLFSVIDEQPVYRFSLLSNFFINKENEINISNFTDVNGSNIEITIPIESKLKLIFLSTRTLDTHIPIEEEKLILGTYLALNHHVVTVEEITLRFAHFLQYLFKPIHLSIEKNTYARHTENVLLRYDTHVFDANGNIVHHRNDLVLDVNNQPIIQFRKGDVILDANGLPIFEDRRLLENYLTFTLIDYKAVLANDSIYTTYKNFLKSFFVKQITENAAVLQNDLLENTVAYVTLPKTLNNVLVRLNNEQVKTIPSLQSFNVEIYVKENTFNNVELRNNISSAIVKLLNDYLNTNTVLRKTELLNILLSNLREHIENVSMSRFTELNAEYIEILTRNSRIDIQKLLEMSVEGYTLRENVNIQYILV